MTMRCIWRTVHIPIAVLVLNLAAGLPAADRVVVCENIYSET
jgi:hypothetical protein